MGDVRGCMRICTVAFLAAFICSLSLTAVYATNFGSIARAFYNFNGFSTANAVSVGNDGIHPVIFFSVESDMATATRWSMTNNYNTHPDISMYEVTGSSAWDVAVSDASYGANGFHGWVDCPPSAQQGGSHPNYYCMDQELRYNYTYSADFDTLTERRSVACHELGHTLGLRHPAAATNLGSCMHNGTNDYGLTQHDINHLSAQY